MTITEFVQANLLWLVPLLTIGSVYIGNVLVRRTGKEANDNVKYNNSVVNETNKFTAITDALFARAEQQDKDMKTLKDEVRELKAQYDAQAVELTLVQTELETERASTKELKRVNASLVRYVAKLTRLWGQGIPLPEPDEAIS